MAYGDKDNADSQQAPPKKESALQGRSILFVLAGFFLFMTWLALDQGVAYTRRDRVLAHDLSFYVILLFNIIILIYLARQLSRTYENVSTTHSLLLVMLIAIAMVVFIKSRNPFSDYSTEEYWASATLSDVETVPEEALAPGNRNGSVLMFASAGAKDPDLIRALINRGAVVNEEDTVYSGTPLSAAAAATDTPAVIDVLVEHGAIIDKQVGHFDKTPLIIAAELATNPEIIERLIFHGADPMHTDNKGRTALDQAKKLNNKVTIDVLEPYYE